MLPGTSQETHISMRLKPIGLSMSDQSQVKQDMSRRRVWVLEGLKLCSSPWLKKRNIALMPITVPKYPSAIDKSHGCLNV